MMTKPSAFSLSLILALGLVACGGGGDSVLIVPASYVPGSAELGAWNVLSDARTLCGFDGADPLVKLTRNTKLDAAALSHSKYLIDLSIETGVLELSHYETFGVAGFTGEDPGDRAIYQDYYYYGLAEILEATEWDYTYQPIFPTMEERGANSMRSLLNTVYHLSGAMFEGSDVGLGAYMKTTMIDATTWREEYRLGALMGYTSPDLRITMGTGKVVTYPCDGSSNIPTKFAPIYESPNPFPDMTSSSDTVGPPIYLKVDAPQILTVNASSSSVSQSGISVPFVVLTNANDPNIDPNSRERYIGVNEVFVIPSVPLSPYTSYQVILNGTVDSKPFTTISFAMSTGS
jgi:hypothetical protein